MIFDLTRQYVPESYVDSRDYRVFLRQLNILLTSLKYNIDHTIDLYDADNCPDQLLDLLASMVGYVVNEDISIKNRRKIIKSFPYICRNRGSLNGLTLAVILSMNICADSNQYFSEDNIDISVTDIENGIITVYYPDSVRDLINWSLVEYVRPVGMSIRYKSANVSSSSEELYLRDKTRVTNATNNTSIVSDSDIIDNSELNYSINTKKEVKS